ncbi:glutamate racemase, partial [Streptomyces sp. SID9944]|nr:glutamate racemase [Streptomyces sp. SID9944]
LRRIGARPEPATAAEGAVTVLLNGREGALPAPALAYAEGRLLQAATPAR